MRAAALLLGLAGCGFGIVEHEPGGGGANLPTLGAGPYGRLESNFDTPADEPFVLADGLGRYAEPDCRARDGGYELFLSVEPNGAPSSIARATMSSLEVGVDGEPDLLAPGRSPSAIWIDGGAILYWEDEGDIVRADWSEGAGLGDPETVLAGGRQPSAVEVDGRTHLFFVRDDAIWVAASDDGLAFDAAELALAPAGNPDGFDAAAVTDPFVRVERTGDRDHWGLWYTGVARGDEPAPRSIGYAGSFDGRAWERFGGGLDPVLIAPARAPCVVIEPGRAVMLFTQEDNLRDAIAAAVHP